MEGNVRDLITEISIHEETNAKLLSQFNELKLKVQDKQTNIKNEEEDLKELEEILSERQQYLKDIKMELKECDEKIAVVMHSKNEMLSLVKGTTEKIHVKEKELEELQQQQSENLQTTTDFTSNHLQNLSPLKNSNALFFQMMNEYKNKTSSLSSL